jgi:hypothetical protein
MLGLDRLATRTTSLTLLLGLVIACRGGTGNESAEGNDDDTTTSGDGDGDGDPGDGDGEPGDGDGEPGDGDGEPGDGDGDPGDGDPGDGDGEPGDGDGEPGDGDGEPGDGDGEPGDGDGDPEGCPLDEMWVEPGCQEPPNNTYAMFTGGCYVTCNPNDFNPCSVGTCTAVWHENICPCPPWAFACCEACGGAESWICVP